MEKKCVICGKPIEFSFMCQECHDKIKRKDPIKISDILGRSIRKMFERKSKND